MREPATADATVVDAARSALLETTPDDTVGEVIGLAEPAEGVVDVHFGTTMAGYPGWSWAVSVSVLDGAKHPAVLELSLLPGEDALVAPEWVPWSDRLADYRAAQEAKDGESVADEDDEDDEDGLLADVEEEDLLGDDEDELDGVDFEDAAGGDDDLDDDELDDDVLEDDELEDDELEDDELDDDVLDVDEDADGEAPEVDEKDRR